MVFNGGVGGGEGDLRKGGDFDGGGGEGKKLIWIKEMGNFIKWVGSD